MPKKDDDAKKPASETAPDQRWKLQVFYLCFYGFMTQMRPGESFITPYLLGADKNFTQAEVSHRQPVLPRCPRGLASASSRSPGVWRCAMICGSAFWVGGEGGMCPSGSMSLSHCAARSVTLSPQSQASCAQAGNHFWGAMSDPYLLGLLVGWQGGAGLAKAVHSEGHRAICCWAAGNNGVKRGGATCCCPPTKGCWPRSQQAAVFLFLGTLHS